MNLGEAIKKVRESQGISQDKISELTGINQGHVSQIENNHRTTTLRTVERFAKVLGLPVPVLIWLSLDESDVDESKRAAFMSIKKPVDEMLKTFFLDTLNVEK